MKKLLMAPILALGLISQPASALTWAEFWEPFTEDHHHPYNHHHSGFNYNDHPVRWGRKEHYHPNSSGGMGWHSPHKHHHFMSDSERYNGVVRRCETWVEYRKWRYGDHHHGGRYKFWKTLEWHEC